MIDDGLWTEIREHTRGMSIDWMRVENGLTMLGVPDLNGCRGGVETWVELKATSAWSVRIRPEQVGWAERRMRSGGRVFLATRRHHSGGPRKGEAVDELWLHHGRDTRHVMKMGLDACPPPLLRSSGGPGRWSWSQLVEILFTC
jgi:Holliday junction resolvase